jgi:hypothetical protein
MLAIPETVNVPSRFVLPKTSSVLCGVFTLMPTLEFLYISDPERDHLSDIVIFATEVLPADI